MSEFIRKGVSYMRGRMIDRRKAKEAAKDPIERAVDPSIAKLLKNRNQSLSMVKGRGEDRGHKGLTLGEDAGRIGYLFGEAAKVQAERDRIAATLPPEIDFDPSIHEAVHESPAVLEARERLGEMYKGIDGIIDGIIETEDRALKGMGKTYEQYYHTDDDKEQIREARKWNIFQEIEKEAALIRAGKVVNESTRTKGKDHEKEQTQQKEETGTTEEMDTDDGVTVYDGHVSPDNDVVYVKRSGKHYDDMNESRGSGYDGGSTAYDEGFGAPDGYSGGRVDDEVYSGDRGADARTGHDGTKGNTQESTGSVLVEMPDEEPDLDMDEAEHEGPMVIDVEATSGPAIPIPKGEDRGEGVQVYGDDRHGIREAELTRQTEERLHREEVAARREADDREREAAREANRREDEAQRAQREEQRKADDARITEEREARRLEDDTQRAQREEQRKADDARITEEREARRLEDDAQRAQREEQRQEEKGENNVKNRPNMSESPQEDRYVTTEATAAASIPTVEPDLGPGADAKVSEITKGMTFGGEGKGTEQTMDGPDVD